MRRRRHERRGYCGACQSGGRQTKSLRADFEKQSELADVKIEAKLNEYRAATDTKIDELTREVREHNSFARRVPVLEEQQRRNDKRLADLEAATR